MKTKIKIDKPLELQPSDFILRGPIVPRTAGVTLFDRIAGNIDTYANSSAIIGGDENITYAELGRRVYLIHDALKAAKVREKQLIGIITRGRSPMIAAMLAVWSVGCAFVPIAGDSPIARRDDALEQIGSSVVLVDTPADVIEGYDCIALSDVLANTRQLQVTPSVYTEPESVAYGFFTSGSTGKPKCCLNPHSGLNNRCEAMSRIFDLKPGQTVLQNSSHVFDSSLWQIFWPLSVGATVVISSRDGILDFAGTLEDIEKHRVLMTDFVPTILEQLVEKVRRDTSLQIKMASMKFLLVGGEAVTPKLVTDFTSTFPHIQLVNTYGPTEASIGMVFHHFTGQETKVPLGLPIDNTALCIVDENLSPLPWGQTGEIVIGGACMGLGYLGNLEKSEQVFIRDSGLDLGSKVVYRTGDIGHVGPDGMLYFSGRTDDQVKINGVRIEFGEIEHRLGRMAHIQRCKVAKVSSKGRSWLAGFYIADVPLCNVALKDNLRKELDAVSIPSLFVQVDDFPITVSGKVDTKTLVRRYCTEDDSQVGHSFNSDIETKLLNACRSLLPGRKVSNTDDVFALGLDSLGEVMLALAVEDILGRPFSTQDLRVAPSVTEICTGIWETTELAPPDIENDIIALGDMQLPPSSNKTKQGILLTGATGYIGRHVLKQLLRTTDHEINCLIRGNDRQKVVERLYEALPDLKPSQRERIKPILVDFNAEGMPFEEFGNPTAILHIAADVNLSKTYKQLRKLNVETVAWLCAFAHANNIKFIQVSSIAALANGAILPDPITNLLPCPTSTAARPSTDYGLTKWAAERVIEAYRQRGLSADIIRLGEVMPDESAPDANPRAAFTILCRAAALAYCLPHLEEVIDYTPMSIVMQYLSRRVVQSDTTGQTINLINPEAVPLTQLFKAVLPDIPVIPLREFRVVQKALSVGSRSKDATRALLLLGENDADDINLLFQSPHLLAHLRDLERFSVDWPKVSPTRLTQMLSKMRSDLAPFISPTSGKSFTK